MIRVVLAFMAGGLAVAGVLLGLRLTRDVPASEFASEAAIESAARMRERMLPHVVDLLTGDVETQRAVLDEHFFEPWIEEARRLHAVREGVLEVDGIYTEVFEPEAGLPPENARRVLINLHGGGFSLGARTGGRLESIPIASVARMRIVSVDYRQGPEHRFPAASEDVATVYRALLREHAPEEIGIFGCSAGGLLTAQSVAWFDAHELPRPGAVGIFCAGAGDFGTGDARVITAAFDESLGGDEEMAYFEQADWGDPLVAPIDHPELLGRFPPTLVVTSTRDLALSSAIATHQRLLAAGAKAELLVFDGLGHFFFGDTSLPESQALFEVVADFFDRHLAR